MGDGWYRAYYQKNTSLYENLSKSLEDLAPWQLELEGGNHFLHWGMSTMALLMAGGEAQIICLLEMVPMLALVIYLSGVTRKATHLSALPSLERYAPSARILPRRPHQWNGAQLTLYWFY